MPGARRHFLAEAAILPLAGQTGAGKRIRRSRPGLINRRGHQPDEIVSRQIRK